jgi:hypothetical protein
MKFSVVLSALLFLVGHANADGSYHSGQRTYEITITNITKGQVFSPPVLVTHRSSVAVFAAGAPASPELVSVAEDGDGSSLASLLNSLPQVGTVLASPAPIGPGSSAIYEISSARRFGRISAVGMLVNTNDAFFAINTKNLPNRRGQSRSFIARAYDAGSEDNNEDCSFIPGPACEMGSGNARDVDGAEGYVHIHNGVHDIADLAPAAYDWRNPVARVTVKRVR